MSREKVAAPLGDVWEGLDWMVSVELLNREISFYQFW